VSKTTTSRYPSSLPKAKGPKVNKTGMDSSSLTQLEKMMSVMEVAELAMDIY